MTSVHAAGPKRAVVIVGPVHSLTSRYLEYGREMADAAEQQGMEVTRIFFPNATKDCVKKAANGANLLIYAGHGNGWPSAYGPFQERTKNGLGLNPMEGPRTTSNVQYYGADWLRENIQLAPTPSSSSATSPTRLATRRRACPSRPCRSRSSASTTSRTASSTSGPAPCGRSAGSRGRTSSALANDDATMDAVFMTRYREPVNPRNGWIGWKPGYFDPCARQAPRSHRPGRPPAICAR